MAHIFECIVCNSGDGSLDPQLILEAAVASFGLDAADENDESPLLAQIEELLKQDESYAAQNKKRQRLVREALNTPGFCAKLNLVDLLIEPLDAAVNKLLKGSGILTKLRFEQQSSQDASRILQEQSLAVFCDWTSGRFGWKVIEHCLHRVRSFELIKVLQETNDSELERTCFELLTFVLSDTWRRCCHSVISFPCEMFALLDCADYTAFFQKWCGAKAQLMHCSECVDIEFATPLLQAFNFESSPNNSDLAAMKEVQDLLRDVATYSPLSSDCVEVSHGQYQNLFHRFRSGRKTAPTAAESSILCSLNQEHAALLRNLQTKTLPTKRSMASIARNFQREKGMKLLSRKKCIQSNAKKSRRRLCGWNVFQKKAIGKCRLSKDEFKQKAREMSKEWKDMPEHEKEAFNIQAKFEQGCRDELATRPLGTATGSSSDAEDSQNATGSIDTFATSQLVEIAGNLAAR